MLAGELAESGKVFQIRETSLQIKPVQDLARADFVASTLNALFVLAREVRLQIVEIGLDLRLRFELSLLEISQLLQRRQTAYQVFVIERATGCEFELPPRFSGDDIEAISFVYKAIVDRSFRHIFLASVQVLVPASEEGRASLGALSKSVKLGPEPLSKVLLGKSIDLNNVDDRIRALTGIEAEAAKNKDVERIELGPNC
jgi:hypothetical protein